MAAREPEAAREIVEREVEGMLDMPVWIEGFECGMEDVRKPAHFRDVSSAAEKAAGDMVEERGRERRYCSSLSPTHVSCTRDRRPESMPHL